MRLTAAAAMLLTASVPALAQGLDPLQDALIKMPEMILSNPAPTQFHFVDMTALQTLAARESTELNVALLTRAAVGGTLPPFNALQMGGPGAWNEKSAVDVKDVRYFAGFGDVPNTISIWGLGGDDAAANLIAALDAGEFDAAGAEGIIGNGKPMAMNPSKMDPADPWRSRVGAATFAAAKGNAIIQAPVPEALPVLLADAPSAGENAVVSAALAGLETALGDDLLVQAMLISPAFGLGSIDPAALLAPGADFDTIRQKLEADLKAGTAGIPPYFGGFVADAQGEQPAVLIALTYADCETAGVAAEQMEQRWRDTMPGTAQGDMETTSLKGADSLCAATLKVVGQNDSSLSNPIFQGFFDAYLRRDFTALQIGDVP